MVKLKPDSGVHMVENLQSMVAPAWCSFCLLGPGLF